MPYVRTQLEREVTGLLGHSKGGLAAMLYACKHDDVPKVVGLAPSFSRKAGLQEVQTHVWFPTLCDGAPWLVSLNTAILQNGVPQPHMS